MRGTRFQSPKVKGTRFQSPKALLFVRGTRFQSPKAMLFVRGTRFLSPKAMLFVRGTRFQSPKVQGTRFQSPKALLFVREIGIPHKLHLFERKVRIKGIDNFKLKFQINKLKPADINNISFIMYKCNEKLVIQFTDVLTQSNMLKFSLKINTDLSFKLFHCSIKCSINPLVPCAYLLSVAGLFKNV